MPVIAVAILAAVVAALFGGVGLATRNGENGRPHHPLPNERADVRNDLTPVLRVTRLDPLPTWPGHPGTSSGRCAMRGSTRGSSVAAKDVGIAVRRAGEACLANSRRPTATSGERVIAAWWPSGS